MTEHQLIGLWTKARQHIIVSQLGPIFLLTVSVVLLSSRIGHLPIAVKIAAALILLSTGVLGAVAQISAANEALAVVADLREIGAPSAVSKRIVASAPWVNVVRFVTPTIFVLTYLALLAALFLRLGR